MQNRDLEIVSQAQRRYVEKYAPKLKVWGNLNHRSVVIDVPCGTGAMSRELHERGAGNTFYLVDGSESVLETAGALMQQGAVTVFGEPATVGQVVNEPVDAVLSLDSFQYLPAEDKDLFLKGSNEALKDNGHLLFDVSTAAPDKRLNTHRFFASRDERMRSMAQDLGTAANIPVQPSLQLLRDYASMVTDHGFFVKGLSFVKTETPVDQIRAETIVKPGRLRSLLPQLDAVQRHRVYSIATQQAIQDTGISTVENTRVFYIAKKIT